MKKFSIISLVFGMLAAAACGRFEEYNTNPDRNTNASSELLATGAMLSTFRSTGDSKAYISYSALPKYVAYLNEGPMEAQYNLIGDCSFTTYHVIPNLDRMVGYAIGGPYEDSYRGLALFLKAFSAFRLTLQTGDIPYSEVGLGEQGLTTPVYDTQESVLAAVLEDLQTAETHFAAGTDFDGDIIYGGSVDKWRRAANSLQLKVLMSMSNKITAAQSTRFAEIAAAGNLFRDNGDNLALVYTTATGTNHPLFRQTLFAPYTTISEVMADELKRLGDRRLFYFAEPAAAQLVAGFTESDFAAYVGTDTSESRTTLDLAFTDGEFSIINLRYSEEEAGDPFIRMSYPEQCFIIAEAIELGWMTGDSQDYYEDGVRAGLEMVASFDPTNQYSNGMPITEDYIDDYLEGEAEYRTATQDRLRQIWFQRYFLKFLQDGYDSYFDFLRTGYPELPLNPATSQNSEATDRFPVRWTYPSGEVQTNGANLNAALTRQFPNGYDGINEVMWLLQP